jgi:hypothetical protein
MWRDGSWWAMKCPPLAFHAVNEAFGWRMTLAESVAPTKCRLQSYRLPPNAIESARRMGERSGKIEIWFTGGGIRVENQRQDSTR